MRINSQIYAFVFWNVLVLTGAMLAVECLCYGCVIQGVQLRSYSSDLLETFRMKSITFEFSWKVLAYLKFRNNWPF